MLQPEGKPTAREVAQGFLINLASENPLTDLEKSLIEKHSIDENKYRWEARYLEVAATEYAFYSLREGKLADRVAAVRREFWKLWQEFSSKGDESAFVVGQCRERLKAYAPAMDKDAQGGFGSTVSTEFAHQFGAISQEALLWLSSAATAIFNGAFYSTTEMLAKTDIKL